MEQGKAKFVFAVSPLPKRGEAWKMKFRRWFQRRDGVVNDMDPHENENPVQIVWIRLTVLICLFIAAVSVLGAFVELFSFGAFLAGKVSAAEFPELAERMQMIRRYPYPFLALTLYTMILWNTVLIASIWLLRFHEWARKTLRALLGFDMIITVLQLLWEVGAGSRKFAEPMWFIFLNTLQVMAIIALSHPRIVEWTVLQSKQRKTPLSTMEDSEIR